MGVAACQVMMGKMVEEYIMARIHQGKYPVGETNQSAPVLPVYAEFVPALMDGR